MPAGWTLEAADFINKLIQRKCYKRLGYYGINEVKRQPWLKHFDWDALNSKANLAPFIPANEDNFSQKVVSEAFRDENDEKFKESLALIEKPKYQSLFDGYYYDYKSEQQNQILQAPQMEGEIVDGSNPEIQEDQYAFEK